MVWDRDVRKPGGSKKNIVVHNKEALHTYGYGPSGSLVSSSQNKVISWILMFIDDVNNARRHIERNNLKDDREGLAGPMDGLIQRPLLI